MESEAEKQLLLCIKHKKSQDGADSIGETTISVDEILSRAESAFARFEQGEGANHISEAVVLDRQALDRCPPDHHLRWSSLNQLAIHLWHHYDCLGTIADIEEATVCSRKALELCPEGHPDRPMSLYNVANYLSKRYNQLGDTTDLNEAIVLGRQALDLYPPGDLDRTLPLNVVANCLSDRYNRLGDMTDVDAAIILGRQAFDLLALDNPNRSASLNNIATYLSARFKRLGDMTDLNEAITLGRQSLDLRPPGNPFRSTSLNNVASYYSHRYVQLGDMSDLNEAITLGRQALDLRPPGHPDRAMSSSNMANYLADRYKRLGDMTDLNEAITLGRQALDLRPSGHPFRPASLHNVAAYLSYRYSLLGDVTDLNEAISFGRQSLDLHPVGHPDRSMSLNNTANHLSVRYNLLGDMTDLNESMVLGRQALDLRPSGHPLRSMSLNNVATCLADRYKRLGDMTDLNEAIVLGRQALNLDPSGHPDRSMWLNNVANCLCSRYNRLGDITDLNEAIALGRQALDIHQSGHPDRPASLNNTATYLADRYKRLGDMADLDEAIIFGREALDLRPPGHPFRSTSLNNVANYHSSRWIRLGDMTDLNEAITLGRQALDLRPPGHPDRSMSLNNVANYLFNRYNQLGDMTDLDEAIFLGRQALNLCPSGHADRSWSLHLLGNCLRTRLTQSRETKDREDLFSLYAELADFPQMVSLFDLSAAREWIRLAEQFHHPTIVPAYKTTFRLLVQHLTTLPSLPNHLQIFKDLASSLANDAFSACLRNECAKEGVQLLEQGRGVFWNQIARLRSPLEDIIASGQEGETLADEFTRLSSEIRDTIHSHGSNQHDRLCSLNVDMRSAIAKIRKLPGFARFLRPSSFSELQHTASGGPVIIVNASQHSCDALVIFFDRDPVHIPLQIMKSRVRDLSSRLRYLTLRAKKMDVKNDLGRLLRDLWDEVVSPIVDFLQTTVPPRSRIWWCPTAEFSLLPLHAAGPYRAGQRNLSRLYISSYTPTLAALIHARRNVELAKSSIHENHFLAVGQATANGQNELFSVGSELDAVAECMQDLVTFTRLEGSESNISRVSEELRKNEWVHFACHGVPKEEKPFESAFALHDGPFTIERIMGCNLEQPRFAYLSACHTTVGDKESPDEVIHLASAMQFAGFRSVIGTMWAVDDAHTKEITSTFYKHILDGSGCLDYTRAALALNKTMGSLGNKVPLDQRIFYVHIGA